MTDEAWRNCTGSIQVREGGVLFCAECGHIFRPADFIEQTAKRTAADVEYESWFPAIPPGGEE